MTSKQSRVAQHEDWERRLFVMLGEMADANGDPGPGVMPEPLESAVQVAWHVAGHALKREIAKEELAFLEPFTPATQRGT